MSIKESSANTLVRFTGMGLINFSDENSHGDISVIRDEKHTFSIRIQKPRFKDGSEKDRLFYEDIAVYEKLPAHGVDLEIRDFDAKGKNSYEIYEAEGKFDRLQSDDTNDFRWLVDLGDLHSNGIQPKANNTKYPINNLSIKNGLFYTHKLDTDLFFEKVVKGATGEVEKKEAFGHIAETIGVKIDAKRIEFIIKIGEKESTHLLEKVDGLPYRIEINNVDYNDDSEISDMPVYYEFWKSQSGREVDLVPMKEDDGELVSGGSVNQITFCHPGKGGGGCNC